MSTGSRALPKPVKPIKKPDRERLPSTCPKCGSQGGFSGPKFLSRPRYYVGGIDGYLIQEETLEYSCKSCSWKTYLPTLDAKPSQVPAAPPPPFRWTDSHTKRRTFRDWLWGRPIGGIVQADAQVPESPEMVVGFADERPEP